MSIIDRRVASVALGTILGAASLAGATHLSTPLSSETLEYEGPQTEQVVLGKIPADDYVHHSKGYPKSDEGIPSHDVVRHNPVLKNGSPVMTNIRETYQGRGEARISNDPKAPIILHSMDGYIRKVSEDTHQRQIGTIHTDDMAWPQYITVLDGWHETYRPNIKEELIGSYAKPEVTFHNPSILPMAMVGGTLGALVGDALDRRYLL